MSKEVIQHYVFGQDNEPLCGAFGEYRSLIKEVTCEHCLKSLAQMGRKALERAFELDYFDVPKEPPSAHDSDV